MNWRRGLLRLWGALAALWIAGVAIAAWQSVPSVNTHKIYTLRDGKLIENYGFDNFVEEALRRGLVVKHAMDSGAETLVSAKWTAQRKQEYAEAVDQVLATKIRERQLEFFRNATPAYLVTALSVPILLLGIGAGIGWILAGFRRDG